MRKIELGNLWIGDTFYLRQQKYKALSVGDKDYNNICCTNLETKKRVWLDVSTDVEVDER